VIDSWGVGMQAFYEAGEDNAVFLAKLEEIKATHR
jgi:hypothetical protein